MSYVKFFNLCSIFIGLLCSLMNNIKEKKMKRWEEVITSTNMTHNSCKAWKTIRNLFGTSTLSNDFHLIHLSMSSKCKPSCSPTAEAQCLLTQNDLYYHKAL